MARRLSLGDVEGAGQRANQLGQRDLAGAGHRAAKYPLTRTGCVRRSRLPGPMCDFTTSTVRFRRSRPTSTGSTPPACAGSSPTCASGSPQAQSPPHACELISPLFAELLADRDWVPAAYQEPAVDSGMGGGIGQWLDVPRRRPVAVAVQPGRAARRDDAGPRSPRVGPRRRLPRRPGRGVLPARATAGSRSLRRRPVNPGDFYTLLPPRDDVHRVRTTSAETSVSIHLLANDTGCVWRHTLRRADRRGQPVPVGLRERRMRVATRERMSATLQRHAIGLTWTEPGHDGPHGARAAQRGPGVAGRPVRRWPGAARGRVARHPRRRVPAARPPQPRLRGDRVAARRAAAPPARRAPPTRRSRSCRSCRAGAGTRWRCGGSASER